MVAAVRCDRTADTRQIGSGGYPKGQPYLTDKRRLFAPFHHHSCRDPVAIEPTLMACPGPRYSHWRGTKGHLSAARFAAVRVRVADGAMLRVRYMGNPHAR